jgi:hypothetical protein
VEPDHVSEREVANDVRIKDKEGFIVTSLKISNILGVRKNTFN